MFTELEEFGQVLIERYNRLDSGDSRRLRICIILRRWIKSYPDDLKSSETVREFVISALRANEVLAERRLLLEAQTNLTSFKFDSKDEPPIMDHPVLAGLTLNLFQESSEALSRSHNVLETQLRSMINPRDFISEIQNKSSPSIQMYWRYNDAVCSLFRQQIFHGDAHYQAVLIGKMLRISMVKPFAINSLDRSVSSCTTLLQLIRLP